MLTPKTSAKQGPAKAVLEIVRPKGAKKPIIPLLFNPTEYQLQKTNNFSEIAIPGLENPPMQYVRGAAEKLTTEVLVDTSDTLADVRKEYTDEIRKLMNINSELHAPPIVRLVWDSEVFLGVVDSLTITYVMFTPEGVPIRAQIQLSLTEYRTVKDQLADTPRFSSTVHKTHKARAGDTLANVANLAYNDPSAWREIAKHNRIDDPRQLEPGQVLILPKLS
jgi:nucleoid-associated protein YgaU